MGAGVSAAIGDRGLCGRRVDPVRQAHQAGFRVRRSWRAPVRWPSTDARGGRPTLDREGVRGERAGANDGDARQRRHNLPIGLDEQVGELVLERGDVLAQRERAVDFAAEPVRAQLGRPPVAAAAASNARPRSGRWFQSGDPAHVPARTGRSGRGQRTRPRTPTPPARRRLRTPAPAHALPAPTARAERAELVVQALLQDAAGIDELAAVTDRASNASTADGAVERPAP